MEIQISLRDYFAATYPGAFNRMSLQKNKAWIEGSCKERYEYADAMMEAREQPESEKDIGTKDLLCSGGGGYSGKEIICALKDSCLKHRKAPKDHKVLRAQMDVDNNLLCFQDLSLRDKATLKTAAIGHSESFKNQSKQPSSMKGLIPLRKPNYIHKDGNIHSAEYRDLTQVVWYTEKSNLRDANQPERPKQTDIQSMTLENEIINLDDYLTGIIKESGNSKEYSILRMLISNIKQLANIEDKPKFPMT